MQHLHHLERSLPRLEKNESKVKIQFIIPSKARLTLERVESGIGATLGVHNHESITHCLSFFGTNFDFWAKVLIAWELGNDALFPMFCSGHTHINSRSFLFREIPNRVSVDGVVSGEKLFPAAQNKRTLHSFHM